MIRQSRLRTFSDIICNCKNNTDMCENLNYILRSIKKIDYLCTLVLN